MDTDQQTVPTSQPLQRTETAPSLNQDKPDTSDIHLAKFIIAYFVGPKMAAVLSQNGIQVDPALATVVLSVVIHRIHVFIVARQKKVHV